MIGHIKDGSNVRLTKNRPCRGAGPSLIPQLHHHHITPITLQNLVPNTGVGYEAHGRP